jgi:hypothetical protein
MIPGETYRGVGVCQASSTSSRPPGHYSCVERQSSFLEVLVKHDVLKNHRLTITYGHCSAKLSVCFPGRLRAKEVKPRTVRDQIGTEGAALKLQGTTFRLLGKKRRNLASQKAFECEVIAENFSSTIRYSFNEKVPFGGNWRGDRQSRALCNSTMGVFHGGMDTARNSNR